MNAIFKKIQPAMLPIHAMNILRKALLTVGLGFALTAAQAQIAAVGLTTEDGAGSLPLTGGTGAVVATKAPFTNAAGITLPIGTTSDASISNGFVRTHDRVKYVVGISPQSGGATLSNVRIVLTYPASVTSLPGVFMQPANGVCVNSPNTIIGAAHAALQVGSQLTCDLPGTYSNSSAPAISFYFLTAGAASGTRFAVPTITVTATAGAAVSSYTRTPAPTEDLTILAVPNWKVSVIQTQAPTSKTKNGPNGEDGYPVSYGLQVYAMGSRLGLEPLSPSGMNFDATVTTTTAANAPAAIPFRLWNWTAANGRIPHSLRASQASTQGLPDMTDGYGGATLAAGRNSLFGCVAGGYSGNLDAYYLGTAITSAYTSGGAEYQSNSTGAFSGVTNDNLSQGGNVIGSNTLLAMPGKYSRQGGTLNVGGCGLSIGVTAVTHNDLATAPLSVTGSQVIGVRILGSNNASDAYFPLGHLNEHYNPSAINALFPAYRKGLTTPTDADDPTSTIFNEGYNTEPASAASLATETWFAANKTLVLWVPYTTMVDNTKFTLTASNFAANGLSGQANPAITLDVGPANKLATANAAANVRTLPKVTTTNIGTQKYLQSTGFLPTALQTGEVQAQPGTVPQNLPVGQYATYRIVASNNATTTAYFTETCEKIDNARLKLMNLNNVYSPAKHKELVLTGTATKASAYSGAGTTLSPRTLAVDEARFLVEYGIRTAGLNTWNTSFASYNPSNHTSTTYPKLLNATAIGNTFDRGTGLDLAMTRSWNGALPANEHTDASCSDAGITWYNTTRSVAESAKWQPIYLNTTTNLYDYDTTWVGTSGIGAIAPLMNVRDPVTLAPSDYDKVQYIRIRPVKQDGSLDTDFGIDQAQGGSFSVYLPVAARATYKYPWTAPTIAGKTAEGPTAGNANGNNENFRASAAAGASTVNSVSPNYVTNKFRLTPTGADTEYKGNSGVNIAPPLLPLSVVKTNLTSGTSNVVLGSMQQYGLQPVYALGALTTAVEDMVLHDVMPVGTKFNYPAGVTFGATTLQVYTTGDGASVAATSPTSVPAGQQGVNVYYNQTRDATGALAASTGFTTLEIKLIQVPYSTNLPSVVYSAAMTTVPADVGKTHINASCITAPNSTNLINTPNYAVSANPLQLGGSFTCTGASQATNVIATATGLAISKTSIPAIVEPGAAQTFMVNFNALGTNVWRPRVIDVLPYTGDNAAAPQPGRTNNANAVPPLFTTTAGRFILRDPATASGALPVTLAATAGATQPTSTIFFTNTAPANMNASADASAGASNLAGSSTGATWCTYAAGTFTRVRGTVAACPMSNFSDVTAYMLEFDNAAELPSNRNYTITVNGNTPTANINQRSSNSISSTFYANASATTSLPSPSPYANTLFATQSISGYVYVDVDNNGDRNSVDTAILSSRVRLDKLDGSNNPIPGKSVWVDTDAAGFYDFGCINNIAGASFATNPLWNGCTNRSRIYAENGTTGAPNVAPELITSMSYANQGVYTGNYRVSQTQPIGYVTRTNNVGVCGGTVTGDQFQVITVTPGANCAGYDFGETERAIGVSKYVSNVTTVNLATKTFRATFGVVVANLASALPVPNVQINDNVLRAFTRAGATPTVSITTAPALAAISTGTCTLNSAFTGQGANTALLVGGDTLSSGQFCKITFTATITYGAGANVPVSVACPVSVITSPAPTAGSPAVIGQNYSAAEGTTVSPASNSGCNQVFASSDSVANASGWTVPDNPATPVTVTGKSSIDLSNDSSGNNAGTTGGASKTAASDIYDLIQRLDSTPTPVVFDVPSVGLSKQVVPATAGAPNPRQVGPNAFEVTYKFLVQNNSVRALATNVQVTDNFLRTFSTTTITPSVTLVSLTKHKDVTQPGSTCTPVTLPGAGIAMTGSFNLLTGTDSLAAFGTPGNDSCGLTAVVRVDYAANLVPTMTNSCTGPTFGQVGCNSAVTTAASTTGAATQGSAVIPTDPTTSFLSTTYGSDVLVSDISNDGATVTTSGATSNAPTPTVLVMQSIRTRKQVGTPSFNSLTGEFTVPYTVVVRNTGMNPATNVQIVDDLRGAYPITTGTGANPTIAVNSLQLSLAFGANATACAVNSTGASSYDGVTAGRLHLLTGNFNLAANEFCTVSFNAVVKYAPIATLPTSALNNNAMGSTAQGSNTGATAAACATGLPNCLVVSAPSTDQPTTPALPVPADNINGSGAGTPTPVTLTPPGPAISKSFVNAGTGAVVSSFGSNEAIAVKFTLTATTNTTGFTGIGWDDTLGSGLKWTSATPTIAYTSFTPAAGAACNSGTATADITAGGVLQVRGVIMPANSTSCEITVSGVTNFAPGATYPTNACSGIAADNAFANQGLTTIGSTTTQAANTPCVAVTARSIALAKSQPSPALSTTVDSSYTITVTNNGTSSASNISVKDYIPANVQYTGFSGTDWTCTHIGSLPVTGPTTVSCTLSTAIAAASDNTALKITTRLLPAGLGTNIVNVVATDPNGSGTTPTSAQCTGSPPFDGCASVTTAVQTIDVVKLLTTKLQTGAKQYDVTYSVTVKNNAPTGGLNATNFQAVEDLASTFATGSPTLSWPSPNTNQPTLAAGSHASCVLNVAFVSSPSAANMFSGTGSLPPQQSCTVNFTVRVVYGAAATVPTAAQANSVIASTYSTAPSVGGTGTGLQARDTSSPAAYSSTLPNADTPQTTDVSFASQQIDTTKSRGTVTYSYGANNSWVKVKVPYTIIVKNTAITGGADATNVQVIDKLLGAGGTFATANNVVVSNTTVTGSTGTGTNCAIHATSPNSTYSGATDTLRALSGSGTLAPQAYCTVMFDAEAQYLESSLDAGNAPSRVPASVDNSAFAFVTANAAPNGGLIDTNGAFASVSITNFIVSDKSSDVTNCTGANCAVPVNGQTASATNAPLTVTSIGSAKRVGTAGVRQVAAPAGSPAGAVAFTVPYIVRVENTGNTPLANVQAIDDLRMPFPIASGSTTSPSILISTAPAIVTGSSASCTGNTNTGFTGVTGNTHLIKTTPAPQLILAVGEFCEIAFTATVTYDNFAQVPAATTDLPNNAFVSSTQSGPNTGHTACAYNSGNISCPPPTGSGTVYATDKSDAGSSATGVNTAGTTDSDPTTVRLAPQKVDVTKETVSTSVVSSDPTSVIMRAVYKLRVKNTGTINASNVQVVDLLQGLTGSGATFAGATAVTATLGVPVLTGSGASTCNSGSNTLTSGVLSALAGTDTLLPGVMCTIDVTVNATYAQSASDIDDARSRVPSTVANTAYASSGTPGAAANNGGTFNASGVWTPANGALASDTSSAVATGCSGTACDPTTNDIAGATTAALSAPALGSAKALASAPTQTGPASFNFVFDLAVQNTGNVTAYKVKVQDYLPAAFGPASGSPSASYVINNITKQSGPASCTAAPVSGAGAYDGVVNTDLLQAGATLLAGESCTVRLNVTVTFAGAIPSNIQNQGRVSSTADAAAGAAQPGFVFVGSGPTASSTAPTGPGIATDVTDSGTNPAGNNPSASGATTGNAPATFNDATPITIVPQEIGVTKAVLSAPTRITGTGAPALPAVQLAVPMQIIVKNTGSITATNVQAIDSLALAFNTATSVALNAAGVVLNTAASTGSAANCAVNSAPFSNGLVTFMQGNTNLAAGEQCVYTFTALVNYATAAAVPASGTQNSAFASTAAGMGGANSGGSLVANATPGGTPTFVASAVPGVVTLAVDTSTNTNASPNQAPCGPTSAAPCSGADTPSPTTIGMSLPEMAVVKAVNTANGAPVQVGAFSLDVPYSLVIKNTGNTVLTNLQLNDNLAAAFPAPAVISFATSPRVVATPAAAPCLANLAFDGATDTRLLAGTGSLALGASCTITVTPRITYPDSTAYNAAAAATHDNSAFGSSATGSAPNAGCASAAACASLANAQSFDQSDSGTNPDTANPAAPGATSGSNQYQDPTPLRLPALNTVNGAVYIDRNANRTPDGVNEAPQSCYMVEVYNKSGRLATPPTPDVLIPYLRTVADANGHYSIPGVPSGPDFVLKFTPVPGVPGTPSCALPAVGATVSNPVGGVGQNGNAGNAGNAAPVLAPTSPYYRRGEIPLMITSTTGGVQVANQNLPIDPAGVIYDSITRLPIAGAVVSIHYGSCAAGNLVPAADLDPSTPSNTVTTVAGGEYQFWFAAGSPPSGKTVVICVTPPAAYVPSALIPVSPALTVPATPSPYLVQPQMTAPQVGDSTTYHFVLNYPTGVTNDVLHNNIPLDPSVLPSLSVRKVGDKTTASMGDTVKYTITVKRDSATSMVLPSVSIVDTLPTGFKLIPGTVTLQNPTGGAVSVPVVAGVGPVLNIPVGALGSGVEATITYRVRVGVGAQLGNGKNTAAGVSGALKSSLASFTVVVTGGVFTSEGCVAGKVFVDCNNNHIQDKGEPGIPGVRLFMEDSTYFVTDSEGKYSYCGLTPTSHIIKVDPASLPLRARLTTSSNRNLGDAGSLMIDLRSGEFARGDFVEGSCTPSLLQEVKSRAGNDGAGAQLVLPKGEGTPDVHKTLDGLVLPRPADPPKPLPGLKGVMSPIGVQK